MSGALKLGKRNKRSNGGLSAKVSEANIEKGIDDILQLDGWRSFKMERNFSEKKQRAFGETGMPDRLYIRYEGPCGATCVEATCLANAQVLWIENKRKTGRVAAHQKLWHAAERKRGALTRIAGQDFEASVDGFLVWYRQSGLMRRKF